MLMPSAFSCDGSSQPPVTRLQSALFASPPASPPPQSTIGNIFTTCCALQSMLTTPTASDTNEQTTSHLPSPPMTHAQLPPMKLRLRPRKNDTNGDVTARKRIIKKRSTAPPRGLNKRRRAVEDEMGRDDEVNSDFNSENSDDDAEPVPRPHTPKRARIAPEIIPLGLDRADFHNLHNAEENSNVEGTQVEIEADAQMWSTEDDRILVELVLEKLKLTKSDWQDCARSLGKDRKSVGRRWHSLMGNGDVGLKTRSRRKLPGTWH